jgi:hypothetical protein
MSIETTKFIKRQDFNKWYECFKSFSGRLIGNPIDGTKNVGVSYVFDCVHENNRFNLTYLSISTKIIEKKKRYSLIHKSKVILKRILSKFSKVVVVDANYSIKE